MRIVQTLMAPIAAPVRKDTLEKESHVEVKLDYDFHAPTSYFYEVTSFIICIHSHFSML